MVEKTATKNKLELYGLKPLNEIFTFDQDVYIGATYIPPAGSKVLFIVYCLSLNYIADVGYKHMIMFNAE